MNERERKALALLSKLFDDYNSLPLKIRMELRHEWFAKKIDQIPSIQKLFKKDINTEISEAVNKLNIPHIKSSVDSESGEIIVW